MTLLENIICKVVDRVKRSNFPDINHSLGKEWNDVLHKELSHVEVIAIFELFHVGHN